MGFLRRVHGVTFRDKVRICKIRKAVNVEPDLSYGGFPRVQNVPGKFGKASLGGYNHFIFCKWL